MAVLQEGCLGDLDDSTDVTASEEWELHYILDDGTLEGTWDPSAWRLLRNRILVVGPERAVNAATPGAPEGLRALRAVKGTLHDTASFPADLQPFLEVRGSV